jgi:hypothetical protein
MILLCGISMGNYDTATWTPPLQILSVDLHCHRDGGSSCLFFVTNLFTVGVQTIDVIFFIVDNFWY